MAAPVITIFGGSGFIGRYVVRRLAKQGWTIRVAVRDPERAKFLRPLGDVGQITPLAVPLQNAETVAAASKLAFNAFRAVAVSISQRVIGSKEWK